VAGKITNNENYVQDFLTAEIKLRKQGHKVMDPVYLPVGFQQSEYMHICFAMIDVCDAIYLLKNWKDSKGANLEKKYAEETGKIIWKEVK